MQIDGLDVANTVALVPTTAVTARSPQKETLRSEVAYLQNQIEQIQTYAQHYNDEQRKRLIEEAQKALASQREGFMRTSERYEQEARDVALLESARATNQAENQLHEKFRQRLAKAEGSLSQHRQEEMAVVSRYTHALRHS